MNLPWLARCCRPIAHAVRRHALPAALGTGLGAAGVHHYAATVPQVACGAVQPAYAGGYGAGLIGGGGYSAGPVEGYDGPGRYQMRADDQGQHFTRLPDGTVWTPIDATGASISGFAGSEPQDVPEPGALALLGVAAAGVLVARGWR